MITIEIDLRIVSPANQRCHWSDKAKRTRSERIHVHYEWRNMLATRHWVNPKLPCVVTLTRIGPRKFDTDNLARGFKAVRDQVATELKIDDGSDLVTWVYEQRKGGRREYKVIIEVVESHD